MNPDKDNEIAALADKRREWVRSTKENGFEDGIKGLLTQLYPDTAHFIFELLQNAEDACASKVRFDLKEDSLTFEHDGERLFSFSDVDKITGIGTTAKKDDPTKIGEFGIGFKAVYAYTRTPLISSGKYHFRIVDMVVPDTIEGEVASTAACQRTSFLFPFDNPDKPPDRARNEIESGLRDLDDATLLFLKNIRKIEYQLPDSTAGSMGLHQCDDPRHVSIAVDRSDASRVSYDFLRFDREVDVIDEGGKSRTWRIAVAFRLEPSSVDGRWRITALSPGRVCIYFPAIKETSNLRFHVHAPFASTVARDSVRECESNDQLRDHLGELIAESMMEIRRYGHLTVSFLAVLPNDSDGIPDFYRPIMKRLIETFREHELLPMKRGGHAPAADVYRADLRVLSDLIDDNDLAVLLKEGDPALPLWIAHPPQRNQRADRFLEMLNIETWRTEDLIKCLSVQSDELERWMKGKPHEWHQRLYALLDEQSRSRRYFDAHPFSDLRIILCADGVYRIGAESYLPDSSMKGGDDDFPRVDKRVYSSGNDEKQQKAAWCFLEQAGVREVDEAVRVDAVLTKRYTEQHSSIADDTVKQDMEAFMSLVEKNPEQAALFNNFFVLDTAGAMDDDSKPSRCKPNQVFIDAPYEATGLAAYHESHTNRQHRKRRLSVRYRDLGMDPQRLISFATAVGAQSELKTIKRYVDHRHPEYTYLSEAPGNWSYYCVDEDYFIEELSELVEFSDLEKARLIWGTMCNLDPYYLRARIRKNRNSDLRHGASTLVHELRAAPWVPQERNGGLTFVPPAEASRDLLPAGFRFDQGDKWIESVEFAKTADDLSAQARRHNFDNYDEMQWAAKIAEWSRAEGLSLEDVFQTLRTAPARAVSPDSETTRADWSSNSASWSEDAATACDPRAVLLAIGEWWGRQKAELRPRYVRLLYPQDFDLARLTDDTIDRSAWLTLFALAAFNTLGGKQDAQHRTFIERGCREGWWQELAESEPPHDVKPWLKRLRTWSGAEQVEEYQLWRRAFVDLYTIVRWLDEYVVVIRKLPRIVAQRGGDPVSLRDVLRPGQSPLLRELGIEAAPLDRTLSIGINWMIRELLRNGTYGAEDEVVMAPYCWMPSRRVRERLLAPLHVDDVSDDANSEDSRHIFRFVVEHVGYEHARFDGDFDLPMQLIARREHTQALNRCFGDGMIGR